jgi:hypothetical protein
MPTTWDAIEPTDNEILENLSKTNIRNGEQRLMLAILENVMEDFQKYVLATHKKGQELFDGAEAWILETDSRAFFYFKNICEHLELDPDYMRKGFMRWKEAKRSQPKKDTNKLKSEAA